MAFKGHDQQLTEDVASNTEPLQELCKSRASLCSRAPLTSTKYIPSTSIYNMYFAAVRRCRPFFNIGKHGRYHYYTLLFQGRVQSCIYTIIDDVLKL